MSYRPVDSKREEFRKYLEKAGAMDALTKVLVMLYDEPEKPTDALDYIRKHLGDNNRPDDAEMNVLKSELEEARLTIQTLQDQINMLRGRLAQYEPDEFGEQPTEEGAEGAKTVIGGKTVLGGKTVIEGEEFGPAAEDEEGAEQAGKTVVGKTVVEGGAKSVVEGGKTVLEGGKTVVGGGKTVLEGGKTVVEGSKTVAEGDPLSPPPKSPALSVTPSGTDGQ